MDLTKIDKPFGLLDEETQKALADYFAGGGRCETFDGQGWTVLWPEDPLLMQFTIRAAATRPVGE